MSLDVSEITGYVDENRDGLIGKVVAGAKSTKILDLQTGFKYKGAINRMDTDVVFQDGSVCGRTPNGETVIDQRILEVGEVKVEEDICPKTLNKTYLKHQLKAGSKDDMIPFEKEYTTLKVKKINGATEKAIWQGDTLSADANLNRFDGLIKLIDAEAAVVDGNTTGATDFTSANAIALMQAMYAAIPASLLDAEEGDLEGGDSIGDVAVLMGADWFRTYTLALTNANLYHFDGKSMSMEIVIPGTNIKAIALPGLTGTDRMFAGRIGSEGGFVVGTDLENEEEDFDIWYSKDDKVIKFDVAFKMGTQIKYPEEIVEFTLAV